MAYDEALADRVRDLMAGGGDIREQRMFGGLAFLVGGHLAVGTSSGGGLMLRVDPDRTEALLTEPLAQPFVMKGRPMAGWLRVAADAETPDDVLARWVATGVDHARGLPPKG